MLSTASSIQSISVERDYIPSKYVSFSWQILTVSGSGLKSALFPSNSLLQWQLSQSDGKNYSLSLVRGAKYANIKYTLVCSYQNSYYCYNNDEKFGKGEVRQGHSFNFDLELRSTADRTLTLDLFIIDEVHVVKVPDDSTLTSSLKKLLESREELSDVTLFIGPDKEAVKASKFILMARSSVFARMFETSMKEQETNEVTVSDVSTAAFKEMLNYIYTDDTPNIRSMAEELWFVAEKYHLAGLKSKCENVLATQLTVENAAHLLVFADTYCGPGELREFVLSFITSDKNTCSKVMNTKEWSAVKSARNLELAVEVSDRYFGVVVSQSPAKKPRVE